ncbi:AAA family ATPase [Pseudomonas syringae]|uniref:AAA family ATPase n=1 Tax=Pseudomonas syringae TaxID=317 RepID=UPI003204C789
MNSNLSIRLLSITVSNFRGIPDTITIPLDAPLTVIHAANGTGKSSICYAIEWLLTGVVNDVSTHELPCQWGNGRMEVSAECLIGDARYELRRYGRTLTLKFGDEVNRINDANLLEMLTPDSVGGKNQTVSKNVKRNWLRSSRWLYSNALALLVDNSRASDREQIFADILGFGHLTHALQKITDYRNALPSTKGVEANLSNIRQEIAELTAKVNETLLTNYEFEALIHNTLERLGLPPASGFAEIKDRLKESKRIVEQDRIKLEAKLVSLNKIYAEWDSYHQHQKHLEVSRSQLDILHERKADLDKAVSINDLDISKILPDFDAAARTVRWADEQLGKLEPCSALIGEGVAKNYFDANPTSVFDVKGVFAELSWPDSQRDVWRQSLNYLLSNVADIDALLVLKKELVARSQEIKPIEGLSFLEAQANQASKKRETAEADFKKLSSASEQLRSLGQALAKSHNDTLCPLCSHDWNTHQELIEAVTIQNESISPLVVLLHDQLVADQASEEIAIKEFREGKVKAEIYQMHLQRLNSVEQQLRQHEKLSNYLEVMKLPDLSGVTVQNIEILSDRLRVATSLSKCLETLTYVEITFLPEGELSLIARLMSCIDRVKGYRAYYSSQEAILGKTRSELQSGRELLTVQLNQINVEISNWSKNLQSSVQNSSALTSAWNSLAPGEAVTLDNYTKIHQLLEIEKAETQRSLEDLTRAEASVNINDDIKSLEKLQNEELLISNKLNKGAHYFSEAERIISLYRAHIRSLSISCLGPVLKPAAELFSRMHANEVYKGLSISEGSDVLRWTAIAEGHEDQPIDAEARFSQGQRQDLALSLYLARARTVGGTFFLDEPIAHLDDLNRVAMLDIFRLLATTMPNMGLILTTSSDALARHISQKFSTPDTRHLLRTIRLDGNPRNGIKIDIY